MISPDVVFGFFTGAFVAALIVGGIASGQSSRLERELCAARGGTTVVIGGDSVCFAKGVVAQ